MPWEIKWIFVTRWKRGIVCQKRYLQNQVIILPTYVPAEMYSKRIKPSHVPKAGRHIYLNHWGNLHKNKLYEWIYHDRQEFSNFKDFKRKLSAQKFFTASSALRFVSQINGRVEKHVLDATDDKYGPLSRQVGRWNVQKVTKSSLVSWAVISQWGDQPARRRGGLVVTAPDLYSGGPGFKSRSPFSIQGHAL